MRRLVRRFASTKSFLLVFRAYQLFEDAGKLGHIGAREELATGHLFGVHLPLDFHQAEKYFQEGVETGSSASHYVRRLDSLSARSTSRYI